MKFWFGHLVILISLLLMNFGGLFYWSATVIIMILFPIIEWLTRKYKYSSVYSEVNEKFGEISLLLMPLSLSSVLIFGFWKTSKSTISWYDLISLSVSCGILLGAFGITSAHELVHRRSKFLRGLGVFLLMLVNFAHWGIEHVYGHHKNVSTPYDPASARRNEIIYSFWIREYFGSLVSSFRISPLKFSIYWFMTAVSGFIIYRFLNVTALLFWLIASLTAILLLQTVDYIEHYGLYRKETSNGRFEPFTFRHAWDSDSWLTNSLLFNLGLHSHHHEKASLSFVRLNSNPAAPRMPVGYSFTVVLALFPFLYIPFMNRKLDNLK